MRPDPFRNQPLPAVWEVVRPTSVPSQCFADEAAIDFPAVHDLVARECDVFLGERHAAPVLATALTLTSREALAGTIIPLDVPLRLTCAECGGRGETWTEPCSACDGTGDWLMRQVVHLTVPPGVAHGARFRFRVASPDALPIRVEVRIAIRRVS